MATHSSVPAWWIPGMGEPGGLPSLGSHRVGHDWSNLAPAAAYVTLAVTYSVSYVMPEIKGSGILIYGWNWAQPASYLFGSSLITTIAQKNKSCHFHRYLKIVLWIFPALPKFSVLHYILEFAQIHAHWVSDPIYPSHPLLSPLLLFSIFPSIRVFSKGLALCIRWPKHWSFSCKISSSMNI